MLLHCGVCEDSWESLGLQGDPTSPFERKSVLNIHWKDWCWSWNSNTFGHLMQRTDSLEKTLMLGKIEGGRRRRWQDEMVGWHHWLNGIEFEQTLGVGDGQGSLVCCSLWGCKESDMTEQLNWTIISSDEHLFMRLLSLKPNPHIHYSLSIIFGASHLCSSLSPLPPFSYYLPLSLQPPLSCKLQKNKALSILFTGMCLWCIFTVFLEQMVSLFYGWKFSWG